MSKYVMALDAGTTSNRCILFNKKGMVKAHINKSNPWITADILLVAPALAFAEVLTTTEVIGKPPIIEENRFPKPCAFNSKLVSVILL